MVALRNFLFLGLLSALVLIYSNCSGTGPASNINNGQGNPIIRGDRALGADVLNTTPASSFPQNITHAKYLGAEYLILDVVWNSVEFGGTSNCTPGTYVDPGGMFAAFNSTLPGLGYKMTLNFSPSTTNIWAAPSLFSESDLLADPNLPATQTKIDLMICRYNNALAYVLSRMPNVEIVGIQIGNEIDYLSSAAMTNFWANYWRFYAGTSAYAKTLRTPVITSALSVGVTASLKGIVGGRGAIIKSGLNTLNQTISSYVAANYYPFEDGGSSVKVSAIGSDLQALVAQAQNLKVRLQESGCQSGSVSGSSESLQSSCFSALFTAWDTHATQISHVNLLRMNDLSNADAYSLAASYTAPAAPPAAFVDYIETLGLRSYGGSAKAAFTEIKSATQSRGW